MEYKVRSRHDLTQWGHDKASKMQQGLNDLARQGYILAFIDQSDKENPLYVFTKP